MLDKLKKLFVNKPKRVVRKYKGKRKLGATPKVFFIGGFWMGKSDIVYQMYDALTDLAEVKLFVTDDHRDVLENVGGSFGYYGTYAPVWIKYDKIRDRINSFDPDIIICCAGGLSFKPEDLGELKNRILVGITLSDPDVFENSASKIAGNFDLFYTNAVRSIADYDKIGVKATLMPFAGNPKFHKRVPKEAKYTCEICFIGNYRPDRVDVMRRLEEQFDLKIFGEGWETAGIKSEGHIEGEEMIKAINSAEICIDFPQTMAGYQNVKVRLFEYGCCGALVVTAKLPEIEKYFEFDKEIIAFQNVEEMMSKVGYYIRNKQEAQSIRENMLQRCLKEHTWQKRFEKVLEDARKL